MMMNKKVFLLMGLVLASQMGWAKGIEVRDAYARETVSGMNQSGAFLTLVNTDNKNNALVGARVSKKIAKFTELHTHIHENGVMKMRPVSSIRLPAKQKVELKSGGYHIMFLGLKQPLQAGSQIPLTLKFQNGQTKTVSVPVKSLNPNENTESHTESHHEHHDELK